MLRQENSTQRRLGKTNSLKPGDQVFVDRLITHIDFAFQPIVNIHSGASYGFEALLRGHVEVGLPSIQAMFDFAYQRNILHRVDLELKEKAISKFVEATKALGKKPGELKLFFNLDNRILDSADYQPGATPGILQRHGLPTSALCLEISERHENAMAQEASNLLAAYQREAYKLAIDDFGAGYSGLQLLYQYKPEFLKIDRFFISGIDADPKKKLMVATTTEMAHILGIQVVAEGIETEKELLACREAGCDYLQGYFIAKPSQEISKLKALYKHALKSNLKERRRKDPDKRLICERLGPIPTLPISTNMHDVFEAFRQHNAQSYFPVVDEENEPLGIVREKDLKEFIYSPFGRDLMSNRGYSKELRDFISACPIAEETADLNSLLTTFSMENAPEGIVIVKNRQYQGMLSAASLLEALNEKNLATARDQNPLTKLPGNTCINDFLLETLSNREKAVDLIYLDFDNFKPFNDRYGFRQGDRAILLFSQLMNKQFADEKAFLGHVGGDDFFIGLQDGTSALCEERVLKLIEAFRHDVESLYDTDDRMNGYVTSKDRDGIEKQFPLLSISAAIIHLPSGRPRLKGDLGSLAKLIAQTKSCSKKSPTKTCSALFKNGASKTCLHRKRDAKNPLNIQLTKTQRPSNDMVSIINNHLC
ncbi:MAG: GGDEF domain-containing protein [Rhodospirillales bacterium]|nr:GGDEF domain-containing protein [Rhodospirillales bacterium]